ncbi:MAG: RdgB/HAM1 family non-canonical purine NTP pyrophosphatase [Desulfohalobiaceae bacterium]|nr:RdgB/HAM1 family non-canonical purine NTP pyrophosphatase [Desulfohalobiaceae bacterium]
MDIVVGTGNKGKLEEIRALFNEMGTQFRILGLDSFPDLQNIPEPGRTFEENALHKARTVAWHTGRVSLADDSGLEVDALGGEPGVYSARYSGPEATDEGNMAKLLDRLEGVSFYRRTARFRCVLAVCTLQGKHFLARGVWEGIITLQRRGDRGFGYDPVFYDPDLDLAAAEMTMAQKNERSHRGRALRDFAGKWPDFAESLS